MIQGFAEFLQHELLTSLHMHAQRSTLVSPQTIAKDQVCGKMSTTYTLLSPHLHLVQLIEGQLIKMGSPKLSFLRQQWRVMCTELIIGEQQSDVMLPEYFQRVEASVPKVKKLIIN